MNRTGKWNPEMRRATLTQFRRLIRSRRRDVVENAIAAGRSLGKLLLDGRVLLASVDDLQLERYRRRFSVPQNLKGVMYAVATGQLDTDMLNIRLDSRFPYQVTPNGKRRFVKRCALCAKRTCRCFVAPEIARQVRKAKAPRVAPILVSVRGIPVERTWL